jgi:flagellar P-ring protein precursor FlgI
LKKLLAGIILTSLALPGLAEETVRTAQVGDIATIEGVRENPVLGYGLVVGLKGTGDRQQTIFTIQLWLMCCSAWECRFPPAQS